MTQMYRYFVITGMLIVPGTLACISQGSAGYLRPRQPQPRAVADAVRAAVPYRRCAPRAWILSICDATARADDWPDACGLRRWNQRYRFSDARHTPCLR